MKILTKQYDFTAKKEPKYLIYLQDDNGNNIEAYDMVGDLNRVIRENELMEDHSVADIRFVDYNTYRVENGILNESYPLILCFYLDRELINNPEIFLPFYESVNSIITIKDANILAFFMPCDEGEDRLECLNPIGVSEPDMDKINNLVKDISKRFDVGCGI